MAKWEYMILSLYYAQNDKGDWMQEDSDDWMWAIEHHGRQYLGWSGIEDFLDEMGELGWELIILADLLDGKKQMYLKRQKD